MKLKDIALLCGVSETTVSKVINNYPDVSSKTRKKIQDMIEKKNFIPNSSARNLKGKRKNIIGLFFYVEEKSKEKLSTSSFYSEFIVLSVDAAKKMGYSIIVSTISKTDLEILEILKNQTIDGAIIVGGPKNETGFEKKLERHKIVFLDKNSIENISENNISIINPDNVGGAFIATEELIKNGHENIFYLGNSENKISSIERFCGYEDALKKYDLFINKNYIEKVKISEENAYRCIIKKFKTKNKITAIFAASDILAIGAMKALKELGYKIPEDISIVGFDNINITNYLTPALTTIESLHSGIAKRSIEVLDKMLNKGCSIQEIVPVKLIVRNSIKNIKGGNE